MNARVCLPIIVLTLGVSACATTSSDGPRSRSDVITQEDIEGAGLVFTTAYEIVRQFQPNWLVKRGKSTIDPGGDLFDDVVIYVDDIRMGGPEALHSIAAQNVREIRHYDPAGAQRLGPRGHPHGAVVVHTKSR